MVGSIGSTGGMSSAYISQMQDQLLKRIDTNGDGSVSKDEFVTNRPQNASENQAKETWSKLDTENTGSLTASQFISAMASVGPPPGPPPGGFGDQSGLSVSSSTEASSSASTSSSSATATSELLQALLAAIKSYTSTMNQNGLSSVGTSTSASSLLTVA